MAESGSSEESAEFHRIWIEQCAATEDIRWAFGLDNALDYLIGEKLFAFLMVSERDPAFAAELPAFVAEIRKLFSAGEIHAYLNHLESARFLAPVEPDSETDDVVEGLDEEPWLENPVMGAEELLRFSRVRHSAIPLQLYCESTVATTVWTDSLHTAISD